MANFDMDSYLVQRFAGVGPNKLAELDQARNDKLAGLQKFRQNITANSANILAEKQANENSLVGQLGLEPDSFSGNAVNLAASAFQGLSKNIIAPLVAAPKTVESWYQGASIDAADTEAYNRQQQGQATPADLARLTGKELTPGEFVSPTDYATAVAEGARDRFGDTKLDKFNKQLAARTVSRNITESFDRSNLIHQGNRKAMDASFADGSQFALDETKAGWQDLKDGNIASGVGNITAGVAQLLVHAGGVAAGNKMGVAEYVAENGPQLLLGLFGKAGATAQAMTNVGYAADFYQQGMEKYQMKHGKLPSAEEQNVMATQAASLAAAEQFGDMAGVGAIKGRKLLADLTGEAEKTASRAGLKEALLGVTKATTVGALTEAPTEGYQTYMEGQILGEPASALDIYKGAAIGGLSGATLSGGGRLAQEAFGTTPEAQDRKLKASTDARQEKLDFAAMAKANDTSTLLDPTVRTYDPLKAVGVLFEHAKSTDTAPEVQQDNLLKAREVVQNLEATQERNLSLIDDASSAERITAAKDELISLKEQLSLTDTDNEPRIQALTKQIAFREEVVALSSDKVALRRLSGEVKRSEQQLSSTRALQENFADRIRKNATVDEVATHIAKATRPMSVDNMPDIEESRQSVEALVNIAMVSPNSISVEAANSLVNNQNSTLTPEQRDYFRQFSEARVAENTLMSLNKVSQSILTGTDKDIGIIQHRKSIGQALEAGDQKAAEKSLLALQTFAQNHAEKQSIATKLFGSIRVSGDKQVLRVKTGGWEVVPPGKPLALQAIKANGGFTIHPNSGEFVGNMQTEVAALSQVVKEQQAAFTLKFGKPSASFVVAPAQTAAVGGTAATSNVSTSVPKTNTSVAPVQKAGESVQVAPAAPTFADVFGATAKPELVNFNMAQLGEVKVDTAGNSRVLGMTTTSSVRLVDGTEVKVNIAGNAIQDGQSTVIDAGLVTAFKNEGNGTQWIPVKGKAVSVVPAVQSTQPPDSQTLSVTKQAEGTARPDSETVSKEDTKTDSKDPGALANIRSDDPKDVLNLRKDADTFVYTDDQALALRGLTEAMNTLVDGAENQWFLLNGKAGTGKTTIVENLVNAAKNRGRDVIVMAPTNKAVMVLKGKLKLVEKLISNFGTIHKTIYGPPVKKGNALTFTMSDDFKTVSNTTILIDEASMVSEKELSQLREFMEGKGNQFILLGDENQLEPVGLSPHIFSTKDSTIDFGKARKNEFVLNEVRRQSLDSFILKFATYLAITKDLVIPKDGTYSDLVIGPAAKVWEDAKAFIMANPTNSVALLSKNEERNAFNNELREARYGKATHPMQEGEPLIGVVNGEKLVNSQTIQAPKITGDAKGKPMPLNHFNPRLGLPAIQATLYETADGLLLVIPNLNGPTVPAGYLNKENNFGKDWMVATYAYALTTHKSQGSQWDHVFVLPNYIHPDWTGYKLLYTAVTRAAKTVTFGVDPVLFKNAQRVSIDDVVAKTEAYIANKGKAPKEGQQASVVEEQDTELSQEDIVFDQQQDVSENPFEDSSFYESDDLPLSKLDTLLDMVRSAWSVVGENIPNITFRETNKVEAGVLASALEKLKAFYPAEVNKFTYIVQESKGDVSAGAIYYDQKAIGIKASALATKNPAWLARVISHELAHLRDSLLGFPSDVAESLLVGGVSHTEALKAYNQTKDAQQGTTEKYINDWFAYIMNSPEEGVNVQHELYAQFHAMYLTQPELMNEYLPQTYQEYQETYNAYPSTVDAESTGNGKSGSTEAGQQPTSTNDAGSTEQDEATPVLGFTGKLAGSPGTLKALQGTKSLPGTLYQDRNLLVDHFSQAVAGLTAASQRPLVAVKDFISSLGATLDFSGFLKDYKATDKQEAVLKLFAQTTKDWASTIQGLLVHGYYTAAGKYNEDRKSFYQNPFNWMIQKDPQGVYSIEENTNTALVYAAFTALLELADAPTTNSDKTLNALLGRSDEAALPALAYSLLGTVGTRANLLRNSTGKTAVAALGLKVDADAGQNLLPQMEGGIGGLVEAFLVKLGLLERQEISAADMNAVLALTNQIDGKEDGVRVEENTVHVFVGLARDKTTGELSTKVKEILEATKGSNNVLDKLFSVESQLKYPSFTPVVSTQTTTKTGQQVPSLLTDTNNQNSSQENFTREDMWKLLNAVAPEVAGAMAGIEEISDTKTQNTKKRSIKAKNDGLWRELNRYHDYVGDVLLASANGLKQAIYFDYSVWLQQRVGIATNVINPQTSKAHRALFYRKTWESKVEIANEAMMDNFLLRVGEGFGVKTDRNTVEASLEKIEAMLESPVIQQAVAALQVVLYSDKGMSKAEQDNLLAAVKEGGENFHSLDALVALAHYYQALDTDQTSFVTHIQAEVDGVANGPILAHALFGAAPDVASLNATMERGGIYTEESGTEAFNEWKSDPLNHDLYENTITRVIQGIANAVSGNWKEANANAVFFFTGMLNKEDGNISSDGRNIIKGPVTEMVFGSGVAKSLNHMAELFIGKVYDVLEKSANGDEKYPPHLVVQNLNKLLSANKGLVPVTLSQAKLFNTEFFLDAAEVAAIKKAFGYVFDAPVTDTIETNFADFIARRDSFTQMAEFAHGVYSTVYGAMRQELIDKLVADDLAKPGTGIPSTYKGDKTNRIPLRDLSKTEERRLEKQLTKMFPVVQTLFSLESKQPKAGLRIGKTSQKVSGSKAYETKVNQRTNQNASTAITVRGLETVQEGPGVGMLPLLIHSLDSYISHSTQMGMELLNIHDAVISGLMTIHEAAEKMNQQTFHALLSYSPMLEMYTALENTILGLSGLVQTQTKEGDWVLGDSVATQLTEYLGQFAADKDLNANTLLLDMLKTAKEEAAKADTIKYEAMKAWAFVNQYAREDSSYAVTEADQTKIAAKLEGVSSDVAASTVRAAEVITEVLGKAIEKAYSPSKKKAQKQTSADNMPDIPEVPVTQTYSTQDIYNALAYNPVSASFDTHLREVLTDIVEKLHGAFGAFKEAMTQPTALSAVDVFAEAVASGKAPLTFSLFGSGIKFNDQQAFVAEQVHATVLASLDSADGNKTVVYTELSKLFRETRTRLKDSAWAKDPATAPLYERLFNQIPTDAAGRSNYLAEFAALGLAHEEFNALLKVPTKMEAAVFTDTTILGVLKRLFAKVLETFNGRLTSTVAGQFADKKLKALVTRLVEIENKRTAVLEAERGGFMRFMDKQAQAVRMGKKSAISKIVNSPKFMKNRNVFIGAASGVVATVADSQVGLFFRNIDRLRNEHFSGQQGITMGFLSEMNGPKPVIQKLLRTIKHFEGQRKKIITMTGKFVLQSFDNQGKDLTDFDKRALTKVLLHTGAHSLLDHFDTDKLLTLLKDPKALASEIATFENQLNGYTPDQKAYFIEQSRALGYWMVTGDITHEMMMKNAHNIARGYESVHAGALSETEVKAATKTLDALASLNALAYTDAAQTGSVVKSLEQELARTDGGNGVRLILLSHKEMEQQAKARLFADGDALMIKGYMPEIYNPHTDVKAANQKEGELLEALGYVAGAAVSNDPADFDPEAKRLYTLRDGAAMPWLSGIFSFTGMRAKGTKHHGPRAHRTQQAITQDKQAAIRGRNPNQSGQNFDPTQVKERHMAPLMNALGQAVNYQYMMRNDTKDNLLERDNRFDSVMGALNGSIFDKENSAVHNRKSVEVFFKEFDEGYTKEPKAYLEVSATSSDPELRDIYNMLPKTTKDAIREVWGKDAMMIRASQLDIAFGYRKLSLSSVFDKEEEDRNFMEQSAVWWSEATLRMAGKVRGMSDAEADKYSKRAAVYVRRGENVWKAVVQETKDIFVIKSGVTALANIVSNLTLLKLYGVGSVSALKDMRIAWVGAQDYTRDTERLFVLEAQLASKAVTSGLSDIKNEISQLKDAIARNPVRELIDAGLMPTIVEDVSQDEDLYAYKTQFVRKAEKYTSKLNKGVLTAGKQMYMAHDTQIYKGLSQLTQLSDFVARYALYQHLTTRKDNPIAQKIAIQEASDAFINYDVPMHRELQYLDDMGIMMFTKYFLRIQRVIRGRFRHAPGKVAMLMLAQGYFDALPTALDSSIFFKIGNNPLSWGALQFPTSLDEMMTTKAALSLFK